MKKNLPDFFLLKSKLVALKADHSLRMIDFMRELTEALGKTTNVADREKIKDLYTKCSKEVTRMRGQQKKLLQKPIGSLSVI